MLNKIDLMSTTTKQVTQTIIRKAFMCMNCQKMFVSHDGRCPRCRLKISYTYKGEEKNTPKGENSGD